MAFQAHQVAYQSHVAAEVHFLVETGLVQEASVQEVQEDPAVFDEGVVRNWVLHVVRVVQEAVRVVQEAVQMVQMVVVIYEVERNRLMCLAAGKYLTRVAGMNLTRVAGMVQIPEAEIALEAASMAYLASAFQASLASLKKIT